MSSHREEHLDLCAGLVLGALSESDRLELESHLAEGCPECAAELSRLAEGVTLLAASAPPAALPPALKRRVFATIREEGVRRVPVTDAPTSASPPPGKVLAMPSRRRGPGVVSWAFAAAAAVLAVTSVAMWQATERLSGELSATRRQLDAQRGQLAARTKELDEARKWSELIGGFSGTRVVDLELTPQGSAVLKARAVYDPQARRAMIVFSNFTAPAGSDYELWALRDGKAASLGLIRADAGGRAIVRLPDTGDPSNLGAFAVSLEKAGGSTSPDAPQGPVVMVGKLAGS